MKWFALTAISSAALAISVATASDATQSVKFESLLAPTEAISQVQISQVIASGQFVTVEQDHPTTGTATIVAENGQRYLEFDAAFTTATGPDVNVVFYNAPQVPVNIDEQNYVTLAPLQSFDGAQRYLIPAEIDLANYEAVGIWCREFNVTFGYATL